MFQWKMLKRKKKSAPGTVSSSKLQCNNNTALIPLPGRGHLQLQLTVYLVEVTCLQHQAPVPDVLWEFSGTLSSLMKPDPDFLKGATLQPSVGRE